MPKTTVVDLGGRSVTVPAGGLYDRYRMKAPLEELAADPRVPGIDFFEALPKTEVQSPIGPTLTPNYYYALSSARLTLLASSKAIRARLPEGLEPLQPIPGLGLVSLMFFRYDVCDTDFYTEAAVGVAVRPARNGGRSTALADLVTALGDDHLHSYVFALPVNTEIAQVRGHDGYGFPKWVTDLDVEIDDRRVSARVANADGGVDVAFTAATPKQHASDSGEQVSSLTSYTRRDGAWMSTLNQTNVLATGNRALPRGYELTLGDGHMSDAVRGLEPKRAVRLDVTTSAQAALHMPVPVSVR
ncbi:acetoacetate decarboxylase family protein [Gordonia sp. X0973]|uniref:acetoacetate decarboxylase family protein n=1 Tax=Gordonia sp. X0973 TaxID=2742602 RepID=UPI000F5298E1|nr:acetoacetate decarboxylase family protein [Gordonia sp. X0973]QKT07758.1 acetoacetate decarboxylase family protein [Gordonia sp. X0973]